MEGEGQPVDITPGGVLRDDAGKEAGYQEAEEEAGDYDRQGRCAPMRRGEFPNEGEHCMVVNMDHLRNSAWCVYLIAALQSSRP